jgi:glycosyltransferase involved in cell wall biosynthesis
MTKKNILIYDSGKEWGGGTNSLIYLLEKADKRYFNFFVIFLFNYTNNEVDIKTKVESTNSKFYLIQRKKNKTSKIIRELLRLILFFNKNILREAIFVVEYFLERKYTAKKIANIIQKQNISLVYGNNQVSSNIEAIIAAKKCDTKYIQHLRITAPVKKTEKYLINNSVSLMVANSIGTSKFFQNEGLRSKIIVLPNAIDASLKAGSILTKQDLNIDNSTPVITMVGSLIKRKRYDIFIQSLNLVNQDFIALIVGQGNEEKKLRQLSKKLGLTNNIKFLGFRSDALNIISLSDIFVLSSDKEPFGRVFLEAMLCKKPIIASDNMQCNQVVVDKYNGYLVKYGDYNELAIKITYLLNNENQAKNMGENGYQLLKEKFDIDMYIKKLCDIFIKYSEE